MKERPDQITLRSASWRTSVDVRPLKWILLGLLLALLLFGHSYGADWRIPSGLRPQMWSRVDYDPKLTDPFFKSDKWSYPYWIWEGPDGQFRSNRSTVKNPVIDPPRLKHTAECFSDSFGTRHLVKFCEERLLDTHTIELFIHHHSPAYDDALRVRIRNGECTCQYWITRDVGAVAWTTTRQKLTLDKKAYRKGDVIKGRIDFECLSQYARPYLIARWGRNLSTIKLFGVFKAIVQ